MKPAPSIKSSITKKQSSALKCFTYSLWMPCFSALMLWIGTKGVIPPVICSTSAVVAMALWGKKLVEVMISQMNLNNTEGDKK